MGESHERCESRRPGWVIATDPARRHPGPWWPLAAALVLTGLGGVAAFGRVGGINSLELVSIVIVLLLAMTLVSSRSRRGGRLGQFDPRLSPPKGPRA